MDSIHPLRASSYIALGAALFWGGRWRLLPSIGVAAAVGLVVERVLKKKVEEIPPPEPEITTYSDWVIIEGETRHRPCDLLDDSFVIIASETTAKLVGQRVDTDRPCFERDGKRILPLTNDRWVELGSTLGQGFTKNVYAGVERGKPVAVGLVHPDNREFIEKERELRGKLPDSPFLAELFEVFVLTPYVVTLAPRHSPRPLHPESARYLLRGFADVARGLEMIHGLGMVYVDMKPQNILWKPEGACLTDFDLMKNEGEPLGGRATPRFVPPEYGEDLREGKVHRPGDIWSLGMTVQQLLFGWEQRLNAPVDRIRHPDVMEVEGVLKTIVRNGQEWFYSELGSDPNMAMGEDLLILVTALRNKMLSIEASQRPTANGVATRLIALCNG